MITERLLSDSVRTMGGGAMNLKPVQIDSLPGPKPGLHYMLYVHVPFCERLCRIFSFSLQYTGFYPITQGAAAFGCFSSLSGTNTLNKF